LLNLKFSIVPATTSHRWRRKEKLLNVKEIEANYEGEGRKSIKKNEHFRQLRNKQRLAEVCVADSYMIEVILY